VAPWFFELLGITPSGAAFETGLFLVLASVGAVLLFAHIRSGRSWRTDWFLPLAGSVLAGGGLLRAGLALSGSLTFGEEGLRLPTYGVSLAFSMGLAIWMGARHLQRVPDPPMTVEDLLDFAFVTIGTGMLGGRLLSLATELRPVVVSCFGGDAQACWQTVSFWDGGLAFYGGVVGSTLGAWWFCHRKKLHIRAVLDVAIPYIAMGHAIGRLGCFAAGCCHGAQCASPWGVVYPRDSHVRRFQWAHGSLEERMALQSMDGSFPVHAAQLYESLGEAALCLLLLWWVLPRRRYVGQLFVTWLMGYAALRFVLELFRGDSERGFLFEVAWPELSVWTGMPADWPVLLSTSQAIALGMVGLALALRHAWTRPPGIEPVRRRRGGRKPSTT
jgi:phosphatidylglycerol:prolipoprotein diacylglycerol transferase